MLASARLIALAFALSWFAACGATAGPGDGGFDAGAGHGSDAGCEGLSCSLVRCFDGGMTELSGTVFAPNGPLPLMNVDVLLPTQASPQTPFPQGCSDAPLTPEEKALVFMLVDLQGCDRR